MNHLFKIGDRVSLLNENETGIVVEVFKFRVIIKKDSGFEASLPINELVPLADKSLYPIDARRINEKDLNKKRISKPIANEVWEVDLHLSEILDTGRVLSDHEKLLAQLKYFHKCMNAAKHHKVKKVIFIHGVGKGTLKQEIVFALQQYEKIRQHDASFKKYGFGAIVVELF